MGIQWNVGGYLWFSAPSMLSNLVLFVGCCVRYIRCLQLLERAGSKNQTVYLEESNENPIMTDDSPFALIYIYTIIYTHICAHVYTCVTVLCLCRFREAHWTPHFFPERLLG